MFLLKNFEVIYGCVFLLLVFVWLLLFIFYIYLVGCCFVEIVIFLCCGANFRLERLCLDVGVVFFGARCEVLFNFLGVCRCFVGIYVDMKNVSVSCELVVHSPCRVGKA